MRGIPRAGLALLILCCIPSAVARLSAQDTGDQALPTGKEIIERMIAAEGGKAAMEKLTTRGTVGKMEIVGAGITATMNSWHARGDYRQVMDLTGLGKVESGKSGEVDWEFSSMAGARILDGVEKQINRRGSRINPLLHIFEDYTEVKVVGKTTILDQECFELHLTPAVGSVETWYVSTETHLSVRAAMTIESPAIGKLKLTTDVLGYGEFDGVQLPQRLSIQQGPQKLLLTVTKYEHNAEVPEDRFKLPPAVKALIDKAKKKDAEKEDAEKKEGATSRPGG